MNEKQSSFLSWCSFSVHRVCITSEKFKCNVWRNKLPCGLKQHQVRLPSFQDPNDADAECSFRHFSMPRFQNEKEHGSFPNAFAKSQFASTIQLICTSISILNVGLLRINRIMTLFLGWKEPWPWLLSALETKISTNIFKSPLFCWIGQPLRVTS